MIECFKLSDNLPQIHLHPEPRYSTLFESIAGMVWDPFATIRITEALFFCMIGGSETLSSDHDYDP